MIVKHTDMYIIIICRQADDLSHTQNYLIQSYYHTYIYSNYRYLSNNSTCAMLTTNHLM